jgi:non-homologous end joining protein Ku
VAEPGYAVLLAALVHRQRWALGRMVLGGHRQIVLIRPSGAALALQVLNVDNTNGDLTTDGLARVQDAVTAADAVTEPYGVAI